MKSEAVRLNLPLPLDRYRILILEIDKYAFIASSVNPDPSLHGRGFVARLSGSTAEFISMWNLMMWGKHPFVMEEGRLQLQLQPVLPAWLFDDNDTIQDPEGRK